MVNFITQLARYLIPVLMIIYTIRCFTAFGINSARRNRRRYNGQNSLMFIIQFTMNFVLFLNDPQISRIIFYAAQVCFLIVALYMYSHIYKEASKMLINNMFFMLMLGFTMLSRLDMQLAIKQFGIAVGSVLLSLVIPGFIAKARHLSHLAIVYGALGIAVIGSVFFFGKTVYGATNWISIGGIGFQPSELAKIIFVFFIASMLYKDTSLKRIIITTICAAAFVVLLVAETDLGAAVIFFITYLVMLYVATRRFLYTGVGLGAGVAAALFGYKHFSHVQRRVLAWRDPWGNYDDAGYQICQSLMAIGTGSWFGMGLMHGSPEDIPVKESDFIFAVICEELGGIFGICLVLVYISCFLMFINISLKLTNNFYKLLAIGLSISYGIQVILCIGGVTKFIPHTGVTMPLVSYGGSSILSTVLVFAVIQGLYLLKRKEEMQIEIRKKQAQFRQ